MEDSELTRFLLVYFLIPYITVNKEDTGQLIRRVSHLWQAGGPFLHQDDTDEHKAGLKSDSCHIIVSLMLFGIITWFCRERNI